MHAVEGVNVHVDCYRWEPKPGRLYETVTVRAGQWETYRVAPDGEDLQRRRDEVQVTVSPSGRSVQVHVTGGATVYVNGRQVPHVPRR